MMSVTSAQAAASSRQTEAAWLTTAPGGRAKVAGAAAAASLAHAASCSLGAGGSLRAQRRPILGRRRCSARECARRAQQFAAVALALSLTFAAAALQSRARAHGPLARTHTRAHVTRAARRPPPPPIKAAQPVPVQRSCRYSQAAGDSRPNSRLALRRLDAVQLFFKPSQGRRVTHSSVAPL